MYHLIMRGWIRYSCTMNEGGTFLGRCIPTSIQIEDNHLITVFWINLLLLMTLFTEQNRLPPIKLEDLFWTNGMKKIPIRWKKCVMKSGGYVEKWDIIIVSVIKMFNKFRWFVLVFLLLVLSLFYYGKKIKWDNK